MNLYFKHRHNITHLSEEKIKALMKAYYGGENVDKLINKYNINIKRNTLYLAFPLKKSDEHVCKYCASAMYFIPPSKRYLNRKEYICTECHHREGPMRCTCKYCVQQEKDETIKRKHKRNFTKNVEDENPIVKNCNGVILEEVSLRHKIFLGAFLRVANPSKNCTISIDNYPNTNEFAPSVPYKNNIIKELLENELLIEINKSKFEIHYLLNIQNICKGKKHIYNLMYPEKKAVISKELFNIIREIQIHEAIAYFAAIGRNQFSIDGINQSDIEKKFYYLFMKMLNSNYSTSQLFNFIYSALRNYAAKNNCTSIELPYIEAIYENISRFFNKAKDENWQIKCFNRAFLIKPSELFKIVSQDILDIGEELFTKVYNG